MSKIKEIEFTKQCSDHIQGIKDAQDLLGGKWKIVIVAILYYSGKKRFMELHRHIGKISTKVLARELQDLETNFLIKRTVLNTHPRSVEYELLPLAESL